MSAAIAPNPNDPQAPLGMPARPWWIGYIRQLHLDIPLAVESGGTGKNTPIDASDIAETSTLKILTSTERSKLAGIAENANNYTHPATHPQSMIEGLESALAAKAAAADLSTHTGDTSNPHGVTKAQMGLGNCDNTADSAKPVSTAQAAAIAARIEKWQYSYFTSGTVNPGVVGRLYAFAGPGGVVMPLAATCAQGDQIGVIIVGNAATITITRSGSDQFVTPTGLATSYTLQGNGSSIVLVRVTTTAWAALGAPDSLINAAIAPLAPLSSPALTGTPTAPTASVGTNTTQIANCAFVTGGIATAIATAMPQFSAVVERTASVTAEVGKFYLNTCTDLEDSAGYLTLTLPSPTGNSGKTIGCGSKTPWSYTYTNEYQAWILSGHINGVSGNTDYQAGAGYDGKVAGAVLWCDGATWHIISATYGGNRN
jgi:hypothetical protein